MTWNCESCTFVNDDILTKCDICENVKKESWVDIEYYTKKKSVKSCYISKSIKTNINSYVENGNLDCLRPVSIYNNYILDEIMKNITFGPNLVGKKFNIVPDNKYLIKITYATENLIKLNQYCCHYDKIMGLTPISMRRVNITLEK